MTVLAALVAAALAAGELEERVNQAIDKGVDWLLDEQQLDGSWNFHDEGTYPAGTTALAVYTLAKSGVPGDHAAIRRALLYLGKRPIHRTYELSCALLAFEALGDGAHRERVAPLARALVDTQLATGLWAYPDGLADLSNTQYALLGLRAAARCGFEVPPRTLKKALDEVVRLQDSYGGFPYRKSLDATGSMTAAGLGCVLVCAELLEAGNRLSPADAPRADAARNRGFAWLEKHFSVTENREPALAKKENDRWKLYYLYGLERVGGLGHVEKFGEHDWYREGAAHLVGAQEAKGAWGNGYAEAVSSTCFALLFLNRATARVTGASAHVFARFQPQVVDETELVRIQLTGQNPYQLFVTGFAKAARDQHAVDGALNVTAVRYYAGDALARALGGARVDTANPERFPIEHAVAANGSVHFRAEVDVAAPNGPATLRSNGIVVAVESVLTAADEALFADFDRGVCRSVKFKASASSAAPEGDAGRAADGWLGRRWLARATDESPWLELQFEKPVTVRRIAIVAPYGSRREPNEWRRPTKVAVFANNRKLGSFALSGAEFAREVFAVPEALGKSFKLVIEAATVGARREETGFAEVELLRD